MSEPQYERLGQYKVPSPIPGHLLMRRDLEAEIDGLLRHLDAQRDTIERIQRSLYAQERRLDRLENRISVACQKRSPGLKRLWASIAR